MVEGKQRGHNMGWFQRYQERVLVKPGAVNTDTKRRPTKGAISLEEAHRVLRLEPGETFMCNHIWRIRSQNCHRLQGDDYWIGTLRPKGQGVAVFVGNKAVGTIEPRGIDSAKKMIKEYGGRQAACVISNTAPGSWNIYVNME
jgi:hypothetical protein